MLTVLASNYSGTNNGTLACTESWARRYGINGTDTVRRSLKELERRGLIEVTRRGIEAALRPDTQLGEHRKILTAWLLRQIARQLHVSLPERAAFVEQLSWRRIQEAVIAAEPVTVSYVAQFEGMIRDAVRRVPRDEHERRAELRQRFERLSTELGAP